MKFYNIAETNEFKNIVNHADGAVWMEDGHGKIYNLRNEAELNSAISEMMDSNENSLELFASDRHDKMELVRFLMTRAMKAA